MIDTSALLRIVLREQRLQGLLSADEAAARVRTVNDWLEAIDLVLLRRNRSIARTTKSPLPMPSGSR